jgi:hypothetical protein
LLPHKPAANIFSLHHIVRKQQSSRNPPKTTRSPRARNGLVVKKLVALGSNDVLAFFPSCALVFSRKMIFARHGCVFFRAEIFTTTTKQKRGK